MPTYQYACTACGERLETVQKFSDDPLTTCPACSGALRKVFSPVGVVFKGSGFYKTDSRTTSKSSASSSTSSSSDSKSSDTQSSDSKSNDSSTTKSDSSSSDSKSSDKPASSSSASSGQVA